MLTPVRAPQSYPSLTHGETQTQGEASAPGSSFCSDSNALAMGMGTEALASPQAPGRTSMWGSEATLRAALQEPEWTGSPRQGAGVAGADARVGAQPSR